MMRRSSLHVSKSNHFPDFNLPIFSFSVYVTRLEKPRFPNVQESSSGCILKIAKMMSPFNLTIRKKIDLMKLPQRSI